MLMSRLEQEQCVSTLTTNFSSGGRPPSISSSGGMMFAPYHALSKVGYTHTSECKSKFMSTIYTT